jgi:hypothetical protein
MMGRAKCIDRVNLTLFFLHFEATLSLGSNPKRIVANLACAK